MVSLLNDLIIQLPFWGRGGVRWRSKVLKCFKVLVEKGSTALAFLWTVLVAEESFSQHGVISLGCHFGESAIAHFPTHPYSHQCGDVGIQSFRVCLKLGDAPKLLFHAISMEETHDQP